MEFFWAVLSWIIDSAAYNLQWVAVTMFFVVMAVVLFLAGRLTLRMLRRTWWFLHVRHVEAVQADLDAERAGYRRMTAEMEQVRQRLEEQARTLAQELEVAWADRDESMRAAQAETARVRREAELHARVAAVHVAVAARYIFVTTHRPGDWRLGQARRRCVQALDGLVPDEHSRDAIFGQAVRVVEEEEVARAGQSEEDDQTGY